MLATEVHTISCMSAGFVVVLMSVLFWPACIPGKHELELWENSILLDDIGLMETVSCCLSVLNAAGRVCKRDVIDTESTTAKNNHLDSKYFPHCSSSEGAIQTDFIQSGAPHLPVHVSCYESRSNLSIVRGRRNLRGSVVKGEYSERGLWQWPCEQCYWLDHPVCINICSRASARACLHLCLRVDMWIMDKS